MLEPLPAGKYTVRAKEKTELEAAMNGHLFAFKPGVVALSNGKVVKFFRDGEDVYSCNAVYAAANFEMTRMK
jgi:hypothetical protein